LITKINDRNVRTLQARYVLNSISWMKIITRNRKKDVKEVMIKSILTYEVWVWHLSAKEMH